MKKYWILGLLASFFTGCASTSGNQSPQEPVSQNEPPVSESKQDDVPTNNAETHKDSAEIVKTDALNASDDALRESQKDASLMIYESWPQETTLDNDHIANVLPVWLEAISGAKQSLDFEEYYAINAPGTGFEKVMDALREASSRGVKIRFIIDKQMNKDGNAELPKQLKEIPNLELREIDFNQMTGGIQHAKFFIVDGKTAYFGSQNFDWRSLEQISEMGARLTPEDLVAPIRDIFDLDWKLSETPSKEIEAGKCYPPVELDYKGEQVRVETVASPKNYLPCAESWDLPKMIAMIQGAKSSVAVQLLNYATVNYDKTTFTELDDALTDAAKRGVHVRLLVSDWSTRPKYMAELKRLADIDNIETRMIEVPEHSSGFVPYSRTIHSKFLVVDDADSWLGTSNWGGDYFYKSRNVGIIVHGKKFNQELTQSFDHYWNSTYAIPVDPAVNYPVKNQAKKE